MSANVDEGSAPLPPPSRAKEFQAGQTSEGAPCLTFHRTPQLVQGTPDSHAFLVGDVALVFLQLLLVGSGDKALLVPKQMILGCPLLEHLSLIQDVLLPLPLLSLLCTTTGRARDAEALLGPRFDTGTPANLSYPSNAHLGVQQCSGIGAPSSLCAWAPPWPPEWHHSGHRSQTQRRPQPELRHATPLPAHIHVMVRVRHVSLAFRGLSRGFAAEGATRPSRQEFSC